MVEKLLMQFDVGPLGAAWRVGLGFLLLPALQRLAPDAGAGRGVVALLATLFCVKVFAAVARRLVGASAAVRDRWTFRRALAARYDSYQWRKLTWIGLGMLAACWARATTLPVACGLGAACLLSGLAGEVAWRRLGVPSAPPSKA
jgi:hypothetical protein